MDLFEYQAKELFAASTASRSAWARSRRRPAEAAGHRRADRRRHRRQGPGQDRRPRQGRRRQGRQDARRGRPSRPAQILGMDIKGHTVHRVLVDPGARHRRGVLRLLPARPGQPHVPRDGVLRGRHGDRAARRRASRRAGQGAGRRARRRRRGQGPRDRDRREVPGRGRRPGRRRPGQAVGGLRRQRRDAGRGQPAGQGARRRQRRSRSTAR